MSSSLSEYLVREGTLSAETIRVALGRQIVYGGALDTALLEMGAVEEPRLWSELSRASGLPIPTSTLVESADPALGALFDLARAGRCRAVPVARRGDTLQLLCGEPIDGRAFQEASAALGLDLELFVVPEVRLKVAHQAVYGQGMAPRFLRLLARLLGAEPVRRWAETHGIGKKRKDVSGAHAAPATAAPGSGAAPENGDGAANADANAERIFQAAGDPRADGHLEALRALATRHEDPRTSALAAAFRAEAAGGVPDKARPAVSALAALRDPEAVVALIGLVKSEDPELGHAAQQALLEITRQDFGASRRRWTAWWNEHGQRPRVDWLFDGLSHRVPEIRAAAADELRALTGESFSYHFDLSRYERDEARRRWQTWWNENRAAAAGQPPQP